MFANRDATLRPWLALASGVLHWAGLGVSGVEDAATSRVEAVALVEGYVVLIERGPENYGAHVPDLPGCVAVGDSAEEVVELMREILPAHIALMREAGEGILVPSDAPISVVAG